MLLHVEMTVRLPHMLDPTIDAELVAREKAVSQDVQRRGSSILTNLPSTRTSTSACFAVIRRVFVRTTASTGFALEDSHGRILST
jgi:hypothetical protein